MKTATMTHVENMNVRQLTTNNNYKNSSPIISSELAEPMRETTLLLSRFQRYMMRAPNLTNMRPLADAQMTSAQAVETAG